MNTLEVFEITAGEKEDEVKVKQKKGSLERILEEYLKIDITLRLNNYYKIVTIEN